jgi:exonuclease SbcC
MIPLSLKLKGLFSYRKEAEIDFSRLSKAGLFGIFGPVGSGKSTILEAVSLALYGESDRLGGRGSRNYNLMNLQSDELTVEYRFTHAGREYLFTVKGSRNSRNFETVKNLERRAYRLEGERWIPLNEANRAFSAEDILGLSYGNFRKTVIVPQGKFMEFLQLGPKDRSNMMAELFHLERYDLYEAAKELQSLESTRLQVLEGKLEQLSGASTEAELALRQKLDTLAQSEKDLRKRREELSSKTNLLNKAAEIERETALLREDLTLLENRKEEMDRRRAALEEFERCRDLFSTQLQGLKDRTGEYNEMRRDLLSILEKEGTLQHRRVVLQEKHRELQESYDQRFELRRRVEQLESMAEISAWEALRVEAEYKLEVLKQEKEKIDRQRKGLELEAGKLREEISPLRQALNFFNETEGLESWYQEDKNLISREKEILSWREELTKRIQKRRERLKTLIDNFCRPFSLIPEGESDAELMPQGLESILESLCRNLEAFSIEPSERVEELGFAEFEEGLGSLIRDLQELSLTEKEDKILHRLRRTLKQGDPCPVCGSREHPALFSLGGGPIVEKEQGEGELKRRERLKNLEALRDSLLKLRSNLEAEAPHVKEDREKEEDLQKRLEGLEQDRLVHREAFRWEAFSPGGEAEFRRQKEILHKKNEELRKKSARLEGIEKALAEPADDTGGLPEQISSLEKERLLLLDRIKRAEEKLPEELKREYSGISGQELKKKIAGLKDEFSRIETEYARVNGDLAELTGELQHIGGMTRARRSSLRESAGRIRDMARRAAEGLSESPYPSFIPVRQVLRSGIDGAAERGSIEAYHRELDKTAEKIEELRRKSEEVDIPYSREEHEKTDRELKECEGELENIHQNIGAADKDLENMRADLELKGRYEKESGELALRLDKLKILTKLFTGKGFVNFVATRYLHELCEKANGRFSSLTHKQLRLELDQENEFVIRDFMNGGRLRSLKTLSGGQLFQASFSLSLALADGIHQNEEGFFFLDEGFGSLDHQSLQDVFGTLKTLRKEHRIVGIISHVEQLRDEIPVFLEVRNSPEEGSVVTARSD